MTPTEILLTQLGQAFDRRSWHGTNLAGSIRGLTPDVAGWRPAADRHNIWELIVHAAYWKYSVWRRLESAGRNTFALPGSNWFPRTSDSTPQALQNDIALLRDYHGKLISAVSGFDAGRLGEIPKGSRTTYLDLIIGAAAHDLYHAGQIQLIKRLRASAV